MKRLTLMRRIAARPSIVFEAITTVDGVLAWWSPEALLPVHAEVDARVGGHYRVRFGTTDGREHEVCGEYLEIVPPRRIVMTYRYAFGGEADEDGRTSRLEFELAPIGDGTELTFTHAELATEVSQKSHEWGWSGALDKIVHTTEART